MTPRCRVGLHRYHWTEPNDYRQGGTCRTCTHTVGFNDLVAHLTRIGLLMTATLIVVIVLYVMAWQAVTAGQTFAVVTRMTLAFALSGSVLAVPRPPRIAKEMLR